MKYIGFLLIKVVKSGIKILDDLYTVQYLHVLGILFGADQTDEFLCAVENIAVLGFVQEINDFIGQNIFFFLSTSSKTTPEASIIQ